MSATLDGNDPIDLQAEVMRNTELAFRKNMIEPMIADFRALGLTDEEVSQQINRVLFDAFQGLHGFPRSQRP